MWKREKDPRKHREKGITRNPSTVHKKHLRDDVKSSKNFVYPSEEEASLKPK